MKTFKNYFYPIAVILFALLSVTFTSCSDDDDDSGSASDLVGTWESCLWIYQEKLDGKLVTDISDNDNNLRILFNEDGTYEVRCYENNKWEFDGSGTWSYKNGVLTINGDDSNGIELLDGTEKISVDLKNLKIIYEVTCNYTEFGKTYEVYERVDYRKISE